MKKILLIGVPNDRVVTYFSSFLNKNKYDFIFVNLNLLGKNIFFNKNTLSLCKKKIEYSNISGIYNRIVSIDLNAQFIDDYYHQLEVLNFLLDHSFNNVINSPSSGSSNNSKPYQLHKACEVGFKIPESIILANQKCPYFQNQTIYKSVGGIRSIVTETKNSDVKRKITCPVLFQTRILGSNVRVHIVDNQLFALKIISNDVDYRYTESPNKYVPINLPKKITRLCQELSKTLSLRFSGIDLMVNKYNEYFFLEANTVPAFTHFEAYMARKKISNALANALLKENN